MDDYQPIDLSALCNGELELLTGHRQPPQALSEGGLERIRHYAVRYPGYQITHQHGEADHRAFLERLFLQALGQVTERLKQAQPPFTGG